MTAVVHIHVMYDAVCHECGWEVGPLLLLSDAEDAAEAHACES